MKFKFRGGLILLTLLVAGHGAGFCDDTVLDEAAPEYRLLYLMPGGSRFDVAVAKECETSGQSPEGQFSIVIRDSLTCGVTVNDITSRGLDLEIEYKNRSYTGANPYIPAPTGFRDLIGKKVRASLNPGGGLSWYSGFEFLPEVGLLEEKRLFVAADYRAELAEIFVALPSGNIRVGDSWTYEAPFYEQMVLGQLRTAATVNCTAVEMTRRQGIDCLKVTGAFEFKVRSQGIDPGSDTVLDLDLTGSGTETFYFATKERMLVRVERETKIEGPATNIRVRFVGFVKHRVHRTVDFSFPSP